MGEISKLLADAKGLIIEPSHWTQGASARNKKNWPVSSDNPDAVCFCADGALVRTAGGLTDSYINASDLLSSVARELSGGYGFVNLNDGNASIGQMSPHQAVLHAFDIAIERAQKMGI
ncbi:hypothetical protein [Bradyrhizobium sp. SZCCHNS3053]|uniref:DUF6197 family protein n=1 Tax=Bradyrhizobium sp. SZCCHNS3053 TaxID=3057322 RepID=UPI002916DD5B|nr:hypothetical protein [Bradyrhizobium sp. SZCCHNS3053]